MGAGSWPRSLSMAMAMPMACSAAGASLAARRHPKPSRRCDDRSFSPGRALGVPALALCQYEKAHVRIYIYTQTRIRPKPQWRTSACLDRQADRRGGCLPSYHRVSQPTRDWPQRRAGAGAIRASAVHVHFDNARLMRGPVQPIPFDVMDVDRHSPRPGRWGDTRQLPDADRDEATYGAFATDLIAQKCRTEAYANGKIECQRLVHFRAFGIEDTLITGLQAMLCADHGPVDDNSHSKVGLVQTGHDVLISTVCAPFDGRAGHVSGNFAPWTILMAWTPDCPASKGAFDPATASRSPRTALSRQRPHPHGLRSMAPYDRGRLRLDRLGRNRAGAAIVRRRPCRLCIAKQNSRARPVLR